MSSVMNTPPSETTYTRRFVVPLYPGSEITLWMSGCTWSVRMYPLEICRSVTPPSVLRCRWYPPVTTTLGLVGSTHRGEAYQFDPEFPLVVRCAYDCPPSVEAQMFPPLAAHTAYTVCGALR